MSKHVTVIRETPARPPPIKEIVIRLSLEQARELCHVLAKQQGGTLFDLFDELAELRDE